MFNSNAYRGIYSGKLSEFEAVVFAPLFHDLDEILDLRVVSVLKHLDDFHKSLFRLFASNDHLEYSNGRTSFALPELWIRVKSLKNIEGLHGMIEESHLVTVISYEIEKAQRLI